MNAIPPPPAPDRRATWLVAGGLVLATLLAYSNSFAGPFVFDDLTAIVHNLSIRHLWPLGAVLAPVIDGGVTVGGRPLVNLSLALNYALSGEQVWSYHVFNLLVHLGAGLIFFGIMRRTLPMPAAAQACRLGARTEGCAALVAAIWLLHPLQTAAVAYTIQRAEAMSALFYLGTLYAFIRSVSGLRPAVWLAISVASCLAGMACKEVSATAPVIVLLYDRTFVAGGFRAALTRRWGYYLALAGTWLLLAWLVIGTGARGGTAGFGMEVSPWVYALTQCKAVVHYLWLTVWPSPLVFDYGIATVSGLAAVWWQALLLAGLLAGTVVALIRRPVLGFVCAWFFVVLAPSSSVVPVLTQAMAEHRMYLALAAPLTLLVTAGCMRLGSVARPLFGFLALVCGILTFWRVGDYSDDLRLWADTLAKYPSNVRAYHNLGLVELSRGQLTKAEQHLRDTIALAPGTPEPLYNLGVILSRQGKNDEAIAAYTEAVRIQPDYAIAHNNLANLLSETGRMEEAGRHYAEAARILPGYAGARNSYGKWLIDVQRPAEAVVQLKEATRLQPREAEMHFNLGNAFASLHQVTEAADSYRTALRLDPRHAEAHNNLGNTLLEQDRVPEALDEFNEALRLKPDYFEPRRTLALVLLQLRRPAEARPHLELLAQTHPGDPEIARALAQARGATR